ncbi:hypothetical protein CMUS01_12598 [Colletotrichum musicola]|uniref:Uncharacterized protein n=1 Tax=Colletotrichum musicola TaxID=2175873 RepID=A0A8H6JL82_9PEZI|nr:hypothetical protein CMUS01_12598 [Colletotrichum musicola]
MNLNDVREYVVHYVGGCLKPESIDSLKEKFPQFAPLVGLMTAEGTSPNPRWRRGTYGEAPSVYRRFVKRVLEYAQRDELIRVVWAINKAWKDHQAELSEWSGGTRVDADSIINCSLELWDLPSDKNLAKLDRFKTVNPQFMPHSGPDMMNILDQKPRRMSAASVAISFLDSAFKRDAD